VAASLFDSMLMAPLVFASLAIVSKHVGPALIGFVYYVVLETIWGRSVGKRAFGLEVRPREGGDLTWRQVALRTSVFSAPSLLLAAAALAGFAPGAYSWHRGHVSVHLELSQVVAILWYAALASTMRRANGYLGLHEVVSRTC